MRVAITGAASGIGAATAVILKAQGAEIIGFDIAEPRDNIDQWIPIDMSDEQAIDAAAAAGTGSFDALINSAGLPPRDGLAEKVLAVNFVGLVRFTHNMLPKMTPGGAIVNVASRAGSQWRDNLDQVKALMAVENMSELPGLLELEKIDPVRAYNLSKEAVIVWTMAETERLLAMNLRMNSVSPSAVSTGILDDFITAFGERATNSIARAGRAGTAEEIAQVIAFLSDPRSHWLKGNDILIDGGMSAMAQADILGI